MKYIKLIHKSAGLTSRLKYQGYISDCAYYVGQVMSLDSTTVF